MRTLLLVLGLLAAAPAHAACPPVEDISVRSAELLLQLREAETEQAARAINASLWKLWLKAPDEEAQALLDEGTFLLRVSDFAGAEAALSKLVAYCPDYAEGYNQRAFAAYLQADYDAALADLDLALERSPTHLGALSGKALTLMGMGRTEIAQDVLRQALALNPWLPERRFLIQRPGEKL